jgi:predicted alpha/beta hydrolase
MQTTELGLGALDGYDLPRALYEPASVRDIRLAARDGHPLAATLYEPASDGARTVIINSATAVRRQFYDKFARFVCGHNVRVITYDYRGIGDSLTGSIRTAATSMRDWGARDFAGVLDATTARFPGSRLLVVGHSVGGQLLGLAENNHKVQAMLAVGAQSGYWRLWPQPDRYALAFLWYVLMPTLTRFVSYFPAKRLGLGENLPGGVALEWARWCRSPGYMTDQHAGARPQYFANFAGEILAYSIDDDRMAPLKAVDALMSCYVQASVERRHVRAADHGVRALGHFGFFKDRCGPTLWQESLEWLLAR